MPEMEGLNVAFYRRTLQVLNRAGVRYMVAGAFALDFHLGTNRKTKDLDVFVTPDQARPVLDALAAAGYRTEMTNPEWIGKGFWGDEYVDVIFGFGNGLTKIDPTWFDHASQGELLGQAVCFAPLEESLWSKAFVQERDRFDGADVAHIILLKAKELDWERLVERFGPDWRVLLAQLIMFGFIYPAERDRVPPRIIRQLLARLEPELESHDGQRLCLGTFLSRSQYVTDLEHLGMTDGRELREDFPSLAPGAELAAGSSAQWNQ